ncbi:MAG: TonB-dependent receptor [Ignavibacteriae bacterium]|nr:hypothetical protein [Ignavibacteriota bacterium]NOG97704.1 TonB-dependent receptor [Ignavibacteriota bacterium]
MNYLIITASLLLLIVQNPIFSFTQDSVRTYKLDEVTVKSGLIVEPKSVTEIKLNSIKKSDASSINEFAKFIPSVKVQNNSRGESQIFLRGSNSRQISIFFDGVPLNIPWDNRIDLSLVPADVIGYIAVTKGIPSIVYGANTLAGVVSINTREIESGKSLGGIKAQLGHFSFKRFSGYWQSSFDKFSYLASISYKKSNGFVLPGEFKNTASNPADYRLNSFSENLNSFVKFNYKLSLISKLGLSFSYIDSEKGVPAEIDVGSPRFWQYPVWKKFKTILNGEHILSSTIIGYSFSFSNLESQINQYNSLSYSAIDDIEKGKDATFFGRVNLQRIFNSSSILRASLSGFSSTHTESFLSGNYSELKYTQNVFSAGAEYEFIKSNFSAIAGASYDASYTPKTGDKPDKEGITDYSFNTSFIYSFNNAYIVKLNFGRKTRFPTLRETFSGALGRFVPNPGLKAEEAYNGEVNFIYQNSFSYNYINLFATFMNDGIVRQSLPGSQFKRINKDKIRILGVEAKTNLFIRKNFEVSANITYLNAFAENTNGEFSDTLEYKPELNAGLTLDYTFNKNFNSIIEANFIGKEFGLKEGSEYFQKLDDYFLLNFRTSYLVPFNENTNLEIFFRVNNIFDKLYYTQWGLPEAGREFFAGFSLEFKN